MLIEHYFNRLRYGTHKILRRIYPKGCFSPTDILLASYPKSGRNWVMFLLINYMMVHSGRVERLDFLNAHDYIPAEIPKQPLFPGFPRIIATHDVYVGQPGLSIYLIRHPADVMVSYYNFLQKRRNKNLGSFSHFIKHRRYGVPAWKSHVISWKKKDGVLFVKFEDLKRDTVFYLERMVKLLGVDIQVSALQKAVERSSLENMRRIERETGLPRKYGANQDYVFVRSGDYRKGDALFTDLDYDYLMNEAGDLMLSMGYER